MAACGEVAAPGLRGSKERGDEAKGDWAMAGLTTIGRSDDGRGQWVMGEGDFLVSEACHGGLRHPLCW